MKKKVKILRGLPGSGKSTWIQNYLAPLLNQCEKVDFAICSADDFFMVNGEYKFDPREISNAHRACYKMFVNSVVEGIETIFVDNTNTQLWEITPYIQFAEMMDYEVEIIEIRISPSVCFGRNVHGVPEHQIMKMAANWQNPLPWWNYRRIGADT